MRWFMTKGEEEYFLSGVCALLHGKDVLVLGSSPNLKLPSAPPGGWNVISVNASGVVAREKGLPDPTVAVFAVSSLLKVTPHIRVIQEKIMGLRGHFVFVRMLGGGLLKRSVRFFRSVRKLRELNYEFDEASAMGPKLWKEITLDVMGEDNYHLARNMSTGVFCIVLAIYAGAKEVAVSGINPSSIGHQYSSKGFERQHSNSDRRMLDFLVSHYSVKIYLPEQSMG